MKKIVIEKEELFEEFLAIFSIGLTYCLENQLVSPCRAEEWLFSPSIALSDKALLKNNIGNKLIDALEYASELEACYGTDYFKSSVVMSREKFVEIVKKSVEEKGSNEKNRQKFLNIGLDNK